MSEPVREMKMEESDYRFFFFFFGTDFFAFLTGFFLPGFFLAGFLAAFFLAAFLAGDFFGAAFLAAGFEAGRAGGSSSSGSSSVITSSSSSASTTSSVSPPGSSSSSGDISFSSSKWSLSKSIRSSPGGINLNFGRRPWYWVRHCILPWAFVPYSESKVKRVWRKGLKWMDLGPNIASQQDECATQSAP